MDNTTVIVTIMVSELFGRIIIWYHWRLVVTIMVSEFFVSIILFPQIHEEKIIYRVNEIRK